MKRSFLLWSYIFFIFISSCGKGFKKTGPYKDEIPSGTWEMEFRSVNPQAGNYIGHGYITHYRQQFWPHFKIYGPPSPVQHRQFLHTGSRCPDSKDDINHDGYIDLVESLNVSGGVLIPLDGALNGQMKGSSHFPRIRKWHESYYYSATSNSRIMMQELRQKDTQWRDLYLRLKDEDLSLDQRVIIIYGAWSENDLPQTVASQYGISPQEGLPVACANIVFRGNFASTF